MADTVINDDRFEEHLMAAIEANSLASVNALLDQRLAANPTAFQWNELGDALNKALALSRYDIADALFKRGALWNYGTMSDVYEGARADNHWNTKAIDVALANGWDINEHYEHVGNALVYIASCVDDDEIDEAAYRIAKHLLSRGADANTGEQNGQNAFELACGAGDTALVSLLLAHGATVARGPQALLAAADRGSVDVMGLLLDQGGETADVNAHPYDKHTLPMYANDEGWGSALHCAIKGGHAGAVRFLAERGADKDYRNQVGMTPLDLARKLGHKEIVALLESI